MRNEFDYSNFIREKMEKHPLLRHMWSRLNKEVIIETTTIKVRGLLKTIDLSYRWFEVEDMQNKRTYFIKWDNIIYLESEPVV